MIGRKERMKSYGSKMYQEIFIYIYQRCSQKYKKQTHFFFPVKGSKQTILLWVISLYHIFNNDEAITW